MYERKHSVVYLGKGALARDLDNQLGAEGYSFCVVERTQELAAVLDSEMPGSLIVELAGQANCFKLLNDVRKVLDRHGEQPRLLVVSDRADQKIRLKAVQTGSDVFLATPVTPRLILQHLYPVSGRDGESHRVLMIDNKTSDWSAETVSQLKHDGMFVRQLENPAQVILSMINFMPDVLIIGNSLPGCHADEIGRMIHQLSDYEDIPVIYLSDENGNASTPKDTLPYEVISSSTGYAEFASRLDRLVLTARNRRNRIQYLRNYDQLTGFLNRDGFFALLDRGFRDDDEAAVLVLQLENLNSHAFGLSPHMQNELVFEVACLLSRSIPSTMVHARVGDYGFAFLCNGVSRQELEYLGQRVCHDICMRMFDIGDSSVTVGCNMGIAVADNPPREGLPLFLLAMQACNEAARSDKHHVSIRSLESVPDPAQSAGDRELAECLQCAVDENLFRLVYQPIASLHGNGIEKYEVLLRLYDRGGRVVPPARFMPVAEKNGLMHSIDRWVIERAMDVLKERGNGTSLFVKVSSGSIRAAGFTAWLDRFFDECGLPGNRLVFEICDANIRAGLKQSADFANHVRQLGCGIALEHNDINRDLAPLLEHVPANYVKINSNAVAEIAVSTELQLKLRKMIALCEDHKARVITGFVENAGDLQLLWKCGVHYIQGNFLQEPNEVRDFDFG
jgi:EAL domain-containing protein (putative c-di-GMP-specific phosphodiesterase class I)/GGDEF domain-containing protein/DNA-binding response OmpR family regulator